LRELLRGNVAPTLEKYSCSDMGNHQLASVRD